ncbi:MAG: hypothetical protein EH225_10915 [Calditrichaeota bacterium]|nr:hypothetical protein [Calditrichota bacterium]RQV99774.1 MAG: hypothetical protein EH225_10915 [Calditrichota bacterium]
MFRRVWDFVYSFRKIFIIWALLILFILLGYAFGLDNKAIAFFTIVFGLISQAFIGLINLIALIPIVGPLIAKVLALPIYWILNALGYFVSLIAIKKGYSKDVINYRVLTIVFLVGLAVGFVIGKLI